MTSKLFLAAITLASLQVFSAHAQPRTNTPAPRAIASEPGWYIGGGLGASKVPESWSDDSFGVSGATASALRSDRSSALARAFVGFRIHRNFGVELGYMDLGRFGAQREVSAPIAGNSSYFWNLRAAMLDAMLHLPLSDRFDVFARIGVAHVATRARFEESGLGLPNFAETYRGNKYALHYGVGATYYLTPNFGLRADWEMFKKASNSTIVAWAGGGELEYNAVSASALWKF